MVRVIILTACMMRQGGRTSSAAADARRDIAQAPSAAADGGAGALPRVPFPASMSDDATVLRYCFKVMASVFMYFLLFLY